MTEKELIEQFSLFGYEILKHGTHYSVFDRRIARRIVETNSLDGLRDYCENIYSFPFMAETLEKTLTAFREMLSPSPMTSPESLPEQELSPASPESLPEESVIGKEDPSDPEQEESPLPPAVPESELLEKVCPTCGKVFQTSIKQRKYCSEQCYPSEIAKRSKTGSEVV